jgi:hypothetical protein
MSALRRFLRRDDAVAPGLAGHAAGPAPSGPTAELTARRDELAERFAQLQWDLGGLAYEMARRDHFRLDVLMRQAARLQEADAELAEAERLLRLEEAAAGGACASCGALHARGAVFCWQCGAPLDATARINGHVAAA